MYHHLFYAMANKSVIKVYTEDKEYLAIFSGVDDFIIVNKAEDADIVLITTKEEIEKLRKKEISSDTIFFTTKYRLLKSYNEIVGAFYWRKGRSQLLFISKRLKNNDITLSSSYRKFIIEKL